MMNFIDISGWQKGLNLENVFNLNPDLDGVIVKSSGGTSWVQSTCDPWIQTAIKLGKPFGFYHYMNDDNKRVSPEKEAEFWVENTRNYFKMGVPFADYEDAWTLAQGTKYLKRFLDRVEQITGVKPVVYCSYSVIKTQDFKEIVNAGYGLWLAAYANMNPTGFQSKPWVPGKVTPFPFYMMHQYSSRGRINGYNGDLDMNLFMGNIDAWNAYVGLKTDYILDAVEEPEKKEISCDVINKVLDGSYGNGEERKHNLEKDGFDSLEVQNKIDNLYRLASIVKPAYEQATDDYWEIVCYIANKIL